MLHRINRLIEPRGRVRVSGFRPIRLRSMRIPAVVLALVACVHMGLWALGRNLTPAPTFDGTLASVSYTPVTGSARPDSVQVTADQIRADLKIIAPYTHAIRTYSSTGGME